MIEHNIIVIASGGFDIIHSGHIALLNDAKSFGNKLLVGVNSDEWLTRKKGRPFMNFYERSTIIEHLNMVDQVLSFDDSDDTACDLLNKIKQLYKHNHIIFVNGGDRTKENIPEMSVQGIEFKFGVGGSDKKNSSSDIINKYYKV